ncbi:MAG: c-type cytochrome biogenesis protein CcsB [Deltaproteobacteria bacterium]|nr:c-type cytochrome biogenesis protein CcsB [Deltaproteobacteria bacterium]
MKVIMSLLFFDAAFWFYLATMILYIGYWILKKEWLGQAATIMAVISTFAISMMLISRTYEAGHAPFSNLYESMTFFVWMISIAYLVMEFKYKIRVVGAFVMAIAFAAMFATSMLPYRFQDIEPLNPALQSIWFELHVFSAFIGYAGFGLAFGMGLMYLIKARFEERKISHFLIDRFPSSAILDELSYKSVAWGFIFFTLGALILGAVWANRAWGTYWSWDPKETWSLITWFVYAAYLHARVTRGWRGKKAAYVAVFGFLSTVFLYWGVSFVLPGLHAYATR